MKNTLKLCILFTCLMFVNINFAQVNRLNLNLYESVQANDLEEVKSLIEQGADINLKDKYGNTLLHLASKHKDCFETAQFLIESGADLYAVDYKGLTPLHTACRNIHTNKVAKLLIDKVDDIDLKVNINSKSFPGWTPLHHALNNFYSGYETAEILINKGANVNISNAEGNTALHLASQKRAASHLTKLIIEKGADISAVNNAGYTALHYACKSHKHDIVELLLKLGADIEGRIPDDDKYRAGYTPLHLAAFSNNIESSVILIENNAKVDAESYFGFTPLHLACWTKGDEELVNLLIKAGADYNAVISKPEKIYIGYSPLLIAMQRENYKKAKLLIEKGADINARVQDFSFYYPGYTPLLFAIENESSSEITEFIIDNGADVKATDKKGNNALHLISGHKNRIDIAKLLILKGANINAKNMNNDTPLDLAIRFNNDELIELLKK